MPTQVQPIIGDWYQTPTNEQFEVVAVDEDGQTVEVQYFDGAVGEFDNESWAAMILEPIEPPDDWSGAYDQEDSDKGYAAELDESLDDRGLDLDLDLDRYE